jgi:hypothetical protein
MYSSFLIRRNKKTGDVVGFETIRRIPRITTSRKRETSKEHIDSPSKWADHGFLNMMSRKDLIPGRLNGDRGS